MFDELGGELNAATSRETTVVYARVPDDRLESALDVMADMVFAPGFADLDSEREVVLEEIAMVEDTPQDLVHDLAAEAVFGSHPLGRPVIGTADVISTVSRRALAGYHRAIYVGQQHRARGGRQRRPRRLAGSSTATLEAAIPDAPGLVRKPARRDAAAPSVRFQRKDTEQYHVCLARPASRASTSAGSPRRSWTRSSAARRRRGSSRRSARSAGWRTRSTRYASQYADTGQIGVYVGTREDNLAECLEIAVAELSRHRRRQRASRRARRAKENLKGRILLSLESTSARMTRLGKSIITETPLLSPETIVRRPRP